LLIGGGLDSRQHRPPPADTIDVGWVVAALTCIVVQPGLQWCGAGSLLIQLAKADNGAIIATSKTTATALKIRVNNFLQN